MNIDIIAIGKIKESYLKAGIDEFLKRLKPFAKISFIEHMEEKMPDSPSDAQKMQVLAKEAEKILPALCSYDFVILLDVIGKKFSSEEFANLLEKNAVNGKSDLAIVIGSAYGLHDSLREKANLRLSFSDFTFTHQMIRLLLVEQIYRAFKIINKQKYHN